MKQAGLYESLFDLPRRSLSLAANSPHAHHLAQSLCGCGNPSCGCQVKALQARAILALMPSDEAQEVADRVGISTVLDEPLTRDEALAVLGFNRGQANQAVQRLRSWLETKPPANRVRRHPGRRNFDEMLGIKVQSPELVCA